jgi:O-antigen/teichoic acid export membrane protein
MALCQPVRSGQMQIETPITNPGRLLIKNLAAQLISTAARLGSLALIPILVARFWGVEAYGHYSTIIAFVLLFKFAIDWGLENLVVREIARDKSRARQVVSASLVVISISAGLAVVGMLLTEQIVHIANGYLALLFMACLWMVFEVVGLFFSGVFYAYEKMEYDTITVLADASTALVLTTFLILSGSKNLTALMACLVVGRMVNVTVSAWICWKLVGGIDFKPNWPLSKAIFISAIPFGLQILLTQNSNLQVIFLNKFHGNEATGLFKAAQTLTVFAILFSVLVGNVFFPRVARAYKESSTTFHALVEKAIHYLLASSLPITIFFFMFAGSIIQFVFGSEFHPSTLFFRILSLALPFSFLHSILAIAITSADRQPQRTAILAFIMLLNIILGLYWIPPYSALGASFSLLVTRIINFILFLLITIKITGWPYRLSRAVPIVLSSTLLAVILSIAKNLSFGIVLPASVAVYCTTLLALDSSIRQDIRRLQLSDILQASARKSNFKS